MGRKSGKGAGGQERAAKVRARRQRIAQDEARREQHAQLVVERSDDPAFAQRVRNPDGSTTVSGNPETATGREIQAGFEAQVEAFRRKFGRDPGPEDPVFFDPDADDPTMLTEQYMTSMLGIVIARIEETGEDAAFVKAWRDLGYVVTTENQYTFLAAETQAWEDAVFANAEDEFDEEFDDLETDDRDVEDFVQLLESILRNAVRRTVEDHTSAPARDVARLIASGDAAADGDVDEPSYPFALSMAFAVLVGWLTGVRERDPDTPMADEAIAWVRAEIGPMRRAQQRGRQDCSERLGRAPKPF